MRIMIEYILNTEWTTYYLIEMEGKYKKKKVEAATFTILSQTLLELSEDQEKLIRLINFDLLENTIKDRAVFNEAHRRLILCSKSKGPIILKQITRFNLFIFNLFR